MSNASHLFSYFCVFVHVCARCINGLLQVNNYLKKLQVSLKSNELGHINAHYITLLHPIAKVH